MNTFGTKSKIKIESKEFSYHSFAVLKERFGKEIETLPYSLTVLLENLLRYEDGKNIKATDIEALIHWNPKEKPHHEIQFTPSRVLLQDFTGIPVVADLTAMRSEMKKRGGDPKKINPLQPVDLVIDHSVQVDSYGTNDALKINAKLEFERNQERYELLKWAQKSFDNFRVVPPATGICHQVNLEHLSPLAGVWKMAGEEWIFPDTVVGTDSHTPMINGLGVLGWGVGGIEAEAAMLGQPCSLLIPQVLGVRLSGALKPGVTATDLVLTLTQMLRKKGVVGQFVEYFGPGIKNLELADRATVSNMVPEYGATVGLFPVDQKTFDYMRKTGRDTEATRAEMYFKAQGWLFDEAKEKRYSDTLELDLSTVEPSVSGPSRPHDRSKLSEIGSSWKKFIKSLPAEVVKNQTLNVKLGDGTQVHLNDGSIVIAAITSCTNTSNPSLMVGAALLARKAAQKGLQVKPWVKTSFAPGSPAVTEYLTAADLMGDLEKMKFNLVGYGCTTCIGNSGPLSQPLVDAIEKGGLISASVLSGNRNFEARINPLVAGNYLMSPPLVVAFAIAGHIETDMSKDPLGKDQNGKPVYLKDIWPTAEEVNEVVSKFVDRNRFEKVYKDIFAGQREWREIPVAEELIYTWKEDSTYIQEPPFPGLPPLDKDVFGARVLALFGDFITTDHISPAGSFKETSEAGKYLVAHGVNPKDFNSYGARRGNHHVMWRGTLANVRLHNKMVGEKLGGWALHIPSQKVMSIYEAAEKYAETKTPLVIVAGKEYGSGSSRDWAAKGVRLLGVRAVLAESYERIHRSNLVGMGVAPLEFAPGETAQTHDITGQETFSIEGLSQAKPRDMVNVTVTYQNGKTKTFKMLLRIDTPNELKYFRSGGVLPYVLETLHA
jgi:aconitate hydratase